MTTRHVLEVDDLSAAEVARVLELAADPARPQVLAGRSVGLYFEKPSLRTRHSCEVGVAELGGHPVTFRKEEVGSDEREPLRGHRPACCRATTRSSAVGCSPTPPSRRWAAASSIPVVNLLSDQGHPCQAMADLLTMQQEWKDLEGRTVAWVGDYNNVARSLCLGAARTGMAVRIACPSGYGPTDVDVERLLAAGLGGAPFVTTRPVEAAEGADAVHTDVWASMGHEAEAEARQQAFEGFTVDDRVDGGGRPRRALPALPARPPRRGGRGVGRRRPAEPGVPPGPQPTARLPGPAPLPARGGLMAPKVAAGPKPLAKPQRQHRIARLLAEQAVTSQAHLVELLAADGVAATQATVSRDLEDLGALKVRVAGGETAYAIPELPARTSGRPRTTSAASSATGWSRWPTPATSSCCAPRRGRPTWWARRSTAPASPRCSAPSPEMTR